MKPLVENFELLCQYDSCFKADVRLEKVVVGFDLPAVNPLAAELRFFLSGVPAISIESLAFLVTFDMNGGQPAKLVVPDKAVSHFLSGEGRHPLLAVLLVSEECACSTVVRIVPENLVNQPPGRVWISVVEDTARQQVEILCQLLANRAKFDSPKTFVLRECKRNVPLDFLWQLAVTQRCHIDGGLPGEHLVDGVLEISGLAVDDQFRQRFLEIGYVTVVLRLVPVGADLG